MVEFRRAKGGTARFQVADLRERAAEVVSTRLGSRSGEYELRDSLVVTEQDTGAKRYQFHYERVIDDIPIVGDFVSVELDPANGEVIGYNAEVGDVKGLKTKQVTVPPKEAARTAEVAAGRLLGERDVRFDSVDVGDPRLAFTSKLPFVDTNRFLAYEVPITINDSSSPVGRRNAAILVDPESGAPIALIPPPPV